MRSIRYILNGLKKNEKANNFFTSFSLNLLNLFLSFIIGFFIDFLIFNNIFYNSLFNSKVNSIIILCCISTVGYLTLFLYVVIYRIQKTIFSKIYKLFYTAYLDGEKSLKEIEDIKELNRKLKKTTKTKEVKI